ncbi:MAG: dicarboxylate/amino acid:cation symporter [Elusimicrobiota bacterium]
MNAARKKPAGSQQTLMLAILAGAVMGILCGWFIGEPMASWDWVGEFFLTCLKMLIVPLVMASMVVGIGKLGDVRDVGRTGLYTVLYYMATTAVAVVIGIVLVVALQPGAGVDIFGAEVPERVRGKQFGLPDFFLSFISPNIVEAMSEMKLLPIIIFSLAFGGVASTLGKKGEIIFAFFTAVNEVIMKMVGLILWLAPVGVFALIAARLGTAGGSEGILNILQSLGAYTLVVLLGLATHAFVVLPLLLVTLGGRQPLRYALGLTEALLSAFATASSSATIPLTLKCLKENNNIREEAADFVIPLGATINMDGTALYEAVAAVFIAQAWGIDLSGGALVLVCLTATLASIGAAGIPQAGLVTMVIVLQAVHLPLEGIGLILAIDWFLDRCRTTVNVWGDSVGAAFIDRRTAAARAVR